MIRHYVLAIDLPTTYQINIFNYRAHCRVHLHQYTIQFTNTHTTFHTFPELSSSRRWIISYNWKNSERSSFAQLRIPIYAITLLNVKHIAITVVRFLIIGSTRNILYVSTDNINTYNLLAHTQSLIKIHLILQLLSVSTDNINTYNLLAHTQSLIKIHLILQLVTNTYQRNLCGRWLMIK